MSEEAAAPETSSPTTPILVWSVVFVAALPVLLVEVAWIMFVLWLPWYANRRRVSATGVFVGCVCAGILTVHACGYKVLGSAVVVDNRPFEPDAHLVAVGPGLRMSLADGRTFLLAGLAEQRLNDGSGRLGPMWSVVEVAASTDASYLDRQIDTADWKQTWSELDQQLRWWKTRDGVPVRVIDQGRGRASFRVGIHLNYFCGNTFFPMPFPARLSRYGSQDLAEVLLMRSDAVRPDGSLTDASAQARLDQLQKQRDAVVGDRQSGR